MVEFEFRKRDMQKLEMKPVKVFACDHCNTLAAACRRKDIEITRIENKMEKLRKKVKRLRALLNGGG